MYLIVKEEVFVWCSLSSRMLNFWNYYWWETCNFFSLYQSPSQSSDSFEEFADYLQLSVDKISNQSQFLTVVLGDFNTKSSNWYKVDETKYEGSKIDAVTTWSTTIN